MAKENNCRVYLFRLFIVLFSLLAVGISFEYLGLRNYAVNSPFHYTKQAFKESKEVFHRNSSTFKSTLTESEFDQLIKNIKQGIVKDDLDLNNTQVCVTSDTCHSIQKYMKTKADEYIADVNKHLDKNRKTPVLNPYPDNIARPNPRNWIRNPTMTVDYDAVDREIEKDNERRLKLGDDDLSKNPRIQKAISESTYLIPNIVHFIQFGCRKFKVYHYMSLLSAFRYQKPDLIILHTNCVPEGDYWNKLKNVTGNTLLVVKRSPPNSIFGNPIRVVEHQADVARLEIVLEVGGIYFDTDFLFLKSFDDLRGHKTVLAEESHQNIGNGGFASVRKSWFLYRWFQEYKNFRDSQWGETSCFVPWALWRLFPSNVTVVKHKILRPNWLEVDVIFKQLWNWRNNYALHLYSRFMKAKDGVEERTLKELAVLNTTYGEVARHVLWGDYHIRKPKDILLM